MSLPADFTAALPAVQAAASATGSDYKALVCIYLDGGPDCHAVLYPTSSTPYAAYAATRGALAHANDGTNSLTGQGAALHAALTKTRTSFNAGKCAIVANVGTMLRPFTKTEIASATPADIPRVLFSHYDQKNEWQSGLPQAASSETGWGGRLMDLMEPAFNPSRTTPSTVSVSGRNGFMDGNDARQFQVGAGSAGVFFQYIDVTQLSFIKQYSSTSSGNSKLEDEIAKVVYSGDATGQAINAAIASFDPSGFPNTGLGQQLKMVARMIQARSTFSHRRDLFYVSLGSFDTHNSEEPALTNLLTQLDDAMDAFYQATKTLGVSGADMSSMITTFTAGDFGRCLVPNNSGTDHGWGGHHFVLGGAVQGGSIYRKDSAHDTTVTKNSMPDITIDGPYDYGQGRLMPTISVDEYSSTLLKWFDLPTGTPMNLVIPNLTRFTTPDLGFMR